MSQNNVVTPKKDEGIPILIPEESILEGFIKTRKSGFLLFHVQPT